MPKEAVRLDDVTIQYDKQWSVTPQLMFAARGNGCKHQRGLSAALFQKDACGMTD
jgi:hypothetical protein